MDLRNSQDFTGSGLRPRGSLKQVNGSLCESIRSESEEFIRLQEEIQFLKKLHEEEGKNRRSSLTTTSTSLCNTVNSNQAFDL